MACECKPGKQICNSCLSNIYDRNRLALEGTTVYTNGNGEYTLNQVNEFEKQFRSNIIADVQNNPLSSAVARYGESSFYDSVNSINNDFLKRDYIVDQLPQYEVLNKRLERGGITPLEFAAFIRSSNYSPASAIVSSNAAGSRFLSELEEFYNGDFSVSVLGGFCGLFNSVFGAINGFFDLIDGISGLISDALSFISKIRNMENPLKALFEQIKVKALLEAIKEKIETAIKKAIEKVQKMIENFSIDNIIGKIETFVQKNIVDKIQSIKDNISEFFTEENIKKILGKVTGLIDYATGLFDNPSVEEIMFMISRFCAFATGIEGLINGLKAPLDDFANRYDEVFNTLSNVSNRVTGEAIRAGAIRFSTEKRKEEINNQKKLWANVKKTGSQTATNDDEFEVGQPTNEEISSLPTWDDIVEGTDNRLKASSSSQFGSNKSAWTQLTMDTKVTLIRLHTAVKDYINGPIEIIGGWVSKEAATSYNEDRCSGTKVQIKFSPYGYGESSVTAAWEAAKKIGVRRFELLNSNIEMDIGGKLYYANNLSKNELPPLVAPIKKGESPGWPPAGEGRRNARRDARKKARETKSTVFFEEGGRTFKAVWTPSTQEGYTENGVETTFGGTVVTTLVK